MAKLYRDISSALCEEAVYDCFAHKWSRGDTLSFIMEYGGIDERIFRHDQLTGNAKSKVEAVENIACALEDLIDDILHGRDTSDMIGPVTVEHRADPTTGKERDIANLDIWHQILQHLVKLALEPLFRARFLPTQHASVKGRGQTALAKQVAGYLSSDLEIRAYTKTDVRHAYDTTSYALCIRLIRQEIPRAKDLIRLMEWMGEMAPGGHLIIGGYLDAPLFNLVASYAMRYAMTVGQKRRGKTTLYIVKIVSYMDDFGLLARSESGAAKTVKKLGTWMQEEQGLELKPAGRPVRFLTAAAEKERREEKRPSKRACPGLDMGGYVMHRTYTTIRPRTFRKARRCWIRSWQRYQELGTLPIAYAERVISYNGLVKNSDAYELRKRYHTDALMAIAKKVKAYHDREMARRKKERVDADYRSTVQHKARHRNRGESSRGSQTGAAAAEH